MKRAFCAFQAAEVVAITLLWRQPHPRPLKGTVKRPGDDTPATLETAPQAFPHGREEEDTEEADIPKGEEEDARKGQKEGPSEEAEEARPAEEDASGRCGSAEAGRHR
jgi:hypothetical protein